MHAASGNLLETIAGPEQYISVLCWSSRLKVLEVESTNFTEMSIMDLRVGQVLS
jgi:hypothetical protein